MLIFPSFHQASDILGEECWLDSVDHIKEVLPVDGGLCLSFNVLQVSQVHLKLPIICNILKQLCN